MPLNLLAGFLYFIQLAISRKVHETIPKGVVGGFEFTVVKLKEFERIAREAMDICMRVLKKSNKSRFDDYS